MGFLRSDLRHALRRLAQSPGYTLLAVVTLALGIAGTTTLFTLVNGLLLKPLPVGEPDRVAAVYTADYSSTPFGASSYPDLESFRTGIPAFDHVVGMQLLPTSLTDGENTTRVVIGMVSHDFFDGLGLPIAEGRGFSAAQARPGPDASVVVLSDGLWAARFGRDAGVVGRSVALGGRPFTVIGVTAPGFDGVLRGIGQEAWVPVVAAPLLNPGDDLLTSRGNRSLFLYAHLAPGATLAQARIQADAVGQRLQEAYPGEWTTLRGAVRAVTVLSEREARLFPDARGPILLATLLLFLVAGAVLLIATANVANLSLSRALGRRREVAIRIALGASRGRIASQFLVESLLVAAAGGGLGLMFTSWAASLPNAIPLPLPVPVRLDLSPDLRVLGFTLLVVLISGLLLGLAPLAQAARPDVVGALKEGTTGDARRSRLRSALVIGQAALSLPLLVLAALFLRSLAKAAAIDPGFGARDGLVVTTDLGLIAHDGDRLHTFQRQLAEEARALPGVTAAGLTATLPLALDGNRSGVTVEGYTAQAGEDMEVGRVAVGPGYFEALELPVSHGRFFSDRDTRTAPGVVIVNAEFARRYWPGLEPLGRRLSFQGDAGPWFEVVGVTGDARYRSLSAPSLPMFYVPLEQVEAPRTTLLIRTGSTPAALAAPVRALVHRLEPTLPLEQVGTLQENLSLALLPARAGGVALGGFGVLGLLLASLGVYGVVAFGVSQRRREIGIRIALGADRGAVIGLAVRDGVRLIAVGLGAGLVLAVGGALLARGLLFGLAPLDPIAFLVAPALFLLVTLAASWLPARRAAGVDPMVAFRAD